MPVVCHHRPDAGTEARRAETDQNAQIPTNEKRRSLFETQDKVDQQRAELIANIEAKLT